MAVANARAAPAAAEKTGRFGGVLTPCAITLLWVIMLLRFGQEVGESGILQAIIIFLCATLIIV